MSRSFCLSVDRTFIRLRNPESQHNYISRNRKVKHNETLFKLLGGFTERVNTKQNPSSVRKSSRVLGICTGVQLVYESVLYSTGVLINKKLQTQLVGYQ